MSGVNYIANPSTAAQRHNPSDGLVGWCFDASVQGDLPKTAQGDMGAGNTDALEITFDGYIYISDAGEDVYIRISNTSFFAAVSPTIATMTINGPCILYVKNGWYIGTSALNQRYTKLDTI